MEVLKTLPDGFVDCCVTSPPYYGLRDYGVDGQIGLEETPEKYIQKLTDVFREVKRVLKDDGTLWVNIGDTYNGNKQGNTEIVKHSAIAGKQDSHKKLRDGAKQKDLIGIPWMLAFSLRADGWYLRQDIIWCLSGGTHLYVKSQKGIRPMMIKDLIRLDPRTVQLWNGEQWVNVNGYAETTDNSSHLELVLRSGERIGATGKHKWVLKDGTEVLTEDLKVGDVLKTTRLPEECTHQPKILSEKMLWLIGLYIAEGSRSQDTIQIALCADEIEWVDVIKEAVEEVGGTVTYDVSGKSLNVRIYSKIFNAVLSQYVSGKTAKDKHLSSLCWNMPNSALKKIVEGYFDGDGHFDSDNNRVRIGFTRNYYWEQDLRTLASRLDATVTINPTFSEIGNKKYPAFRGEWRWERSNHHNEKDRAEIVEIRKSRARHFYDISVDCENHLFALASGVLTHNCKPNPMPESVKDRCTKSHEYIFLLSKKPRYYFDYEAIQEYATGYDGRKDTTNKGSRKYADRSYLQGGNQQTMAAKGHERWQYKNLAEKGQMPNTMHVRRANGESDIAYPVRNKRDVWTVPTQPIKEAHFATFPEELIKPCILAGARPNGIVLDPFFGSGTTGRVAISLNRRYLGIELNPEYVEIEKRRTGSVQMSFEGIMA